MTTPRKSNSAPSGAAKAALGRFVILAVQGLDRDGRDRIAPGAAFLNLTPAPPFSVARESGKRHWRWVSAQCGAAVFPCRSCGRRPIGCARAARLVAVTSWQRCGDRHRNRREGRVVDGRRHRHWLCRARTCHACCPSRSKARCSLLCRVSDRRDLGRLRGDRRFCFRLVRAWIDDLAGNRSWPRRTNLDLRTDKRRAPRSTWRDRSNLGAKRRPPENSAA